MVVKISGGSAGSCEGLVNYLEKQERGQWFSQEQQGLPALLVTPAIDQNKRNLGRQEEKFYQVIISPSQSELRHIEEDPVRLREYVRQVMNHYAHNFGKGIAGKDLVWFGKIERERSHSSQDRAVQLGEEQKGKKKPGAQTHVHVIVSRTENLQGFKAQQQGGGLLRKHPLKLSPATNHRATEKGAVKGGFDRSAFIQMSEEQFDRQFHYERPLIERFEYSRIQQHGTQQERVAQRLEILRAEAQKKEQERLQQAQEQMEVQKSREQQQSVIRQVQEVKRRRLR
ncbi:DUF5712 family protein [Telluribacter humicola]|uniref:DUF5712 family protein n=1 Tax=Telluribacter humicola TaxID=1720261 RepID=UPI001A95B35F|nr:DUF5712 family protein [Telluribacter humicola]